MSDRRERIEIDIAPGTLYVRHARCPGGCDLMDPGLPIRGQPSIHLAYRHAGGEGHIRVDSFYGKFENVEDREIPDGAVVEFFCPHCRVSLEASGDRCGVCSAPMFVLHLPHGGVVEACQRKACFHHKLRLVSDEEELQRLFDRLATDNYL
jgi:hypothetical protein